MNKKLSLGMVLGLLFIVVVITSTITISITTSQYNQILEGLPEKIEKYDVLDELDSILSKNYYNEDADEIILEAMAQGYLEGLNDGNCEYFTEEEYADYKAETIGEMDGIGITVSKNDDGYMKITAVYDGSPALEAGLEVGYVIVAFDGIDLSDDTYDEMLERIQTDKVSSVNLTYVVDEERITVDITTGYMAQSVKTEIYESVGYIKISNFYSTTTAEIQAAVDMFQASGIEALVLDLRDNSSVNYAYAIEALDIFAPMTDSTTPAMQVLGEDDIVLATYETTAGEINLPVMVLINSNTKGAAEIFACNMRDFSKAELLGTTTAGDGLMQEVFELSSGSAVLITTGKIMPYKSENFNDIGLEPDYVVNEEANYDNLEEDIAFMQAASILTQE